MLSRALFEYWHIIALGAAMIAWRIWGHHVTASFRRLEQQRARAELQTLYDRANPNSHFRHSVEQINEDTPPVQPDPHQPGAYGWSGTLYHSREAAEAARKQAEDAAVLMDNLKHLATEGGRRGAAGGVLRAGGGGGAGSDQRQPIGCRHPHVRA